MPPPVTGDTVPAASPINITRLVPISFSVPPAGINPLRRAVTRISRMSHTVFSRSSNSPRVRLGRTPRGDADLRHLHAGHRPGDVARRDLAVGEAMQEARGREHPAARTRSQGPPGNACCATGRSLCHLRPRTIGADKEARMQAQFGQRHAAPCSTAPSNFLPYSSVAPARSASAAMPAMTLGVSVAWKK